MKAIITALFVTLAAVPLTSVALEDDQVRGEVVSVSKSSNELTIRVKASGDDIAAPSGSQQTYYIPPGTPIHYEVDRRYFALDRPGELSIGELYKGDTVMLDFEEINARRQARIVRSEVTTNTSVRDRVRREGRFVGERVDERINSRPMMANNLVSNNRSRLPDTASVLPLMALGGAFFAIAGGFVRRLRNS